MSTNKIAPYTEPHLLVISCHLIILYTLIKSMKEYKMRDWLIISFMSMRNLPSTTNYAKLR